MKVQWGIPLAQIKAFAPFRIAQNGRPPNVLVGPWTRYTARMLAGFPTFMNWPLSIERTATIQKGKWRKTQKDPMPMFQETLITPKSLSTGKNGVHYFGMVVYLEGVATIVADEGNHWGTTGNIASRSSGREVRTRVPTFCLWSIVVGEPSPQKVGKRALLGT